jgi:hypothetical protein
VVWTTTPLSGPPSGAAGGDLAGSTYPGPFVAPGAITFAKLATDAKPWTISGTTLTPTDATKIVSVPGDATAGTVLVGGGGGSTTKTRLHAPNSTDAMVLTLNRNWAAGNAQDDATKPSWGMQFVPGTGAADHFYIQHSPAGSVTQTTMLDLDGTGKLTLPGDSTAQFTVLGTQTAKTRLIASNTLTWASWSLNNNTFANTQDDATKPSWEILLRPDNDRIEMRRKAPAGGLTTPLYLNGADGKTYCTLANNSINAPMLGIGTTIRAGATGNMTANFNSNNVTGTWISVGSVAITTSGGYVLVSAVPALIYAGASGVVVYTAIKRDATILASWKFTPSASTGGVLQWPLPATGVIWDAAPAGAHTYYVIVYVGTTAANILTPPDSPGYIIAYELC